MSTASTASRATQPWAPPVVSDRLNGTHDGSQPAGGQSTTPLQPSPKSPSASPSVTTLFAAIAHHLETAWAPTRGTNSNGPTLPLDPPAVRSDHRASATLKPLGTLSSAAVAAFAASPRPITLSAASCHSRARISSRAAPSSLEASRKPCPTSAIARPDALIRSPNPRSNGSALTVRQWLESANRQLSRSRPR